MHTLLAFDPGETTGFCKIEISDDGKDFSVIECKEIRWEDRIPSLMNIFKSAAGEVTVVIESFRLFPHRARQQIGSEFPSVRVIGNIEIAVHVCMIGIDRIHFQEPGDITRVTVLERDLKQVAGSPHKIDAYRHARLYYLKHFYLNPFEHA